jgi:hypothetical protein
MIVCQAVFVALKFVSDGVKLNQQKPSFQAWAGFWFEELAPIALARSNAPIVPWPRVGRVFDRERERAGVVHRRCSLDGWKVTECRVVGA